MDLYSVRHSLSLGIPLSNLKLRVTDYSRVSTDDIKQKNSLRNQTKHFSEMIMQNKNWTYVGGYVDDGITGTSDVKRDNFMRMIEDGKKGKFDLIITKEISRFSRNTLDSIRYTRELLQCGVGVLFVNDNINTIMPDSELRLTIMASMAQDEIRRLSERVKFGMNRAIIDGHILGNDRLYGYRKNKLSGNLEIVFEEGEIVKKIYDMYVIQNMSLNKIVKFLNECNITTSMNNKFSVSTLSRMLRNPKYKGFYCGKKSEVVDYMTKKVKYFDKKNWVMYEDKIKIPPIVSEEIWNRAFYKLEKRGVKFGKNDDNKFRYKRNYSLSGKLICAKHNSVFYRRKLSKNSDDIVWWCSEYLMHGKHSCDVLGIRQSELYCIFDDVLKKIDIDLNKVIDRLLGLYLNNNSNIKEMIKKYDEGYKKIEQKKTHLLELNMDGTLSDFEFKKMNNRYNEQICEINEKKRELIKSLDCFYNTVDKKRELKDILNKIVLMDCVREYLIELLLYKIVILSNDSDNIRLDIFLNFSNEYIKKEMRDYIISNVDGFIFFFDSSYRFKRGYDKVGTKRYCVKYNVNCYGVNSL